MEFLASIELDIESLVKLLSTCKTFWQHRYRTKYSHFAHLGKYANTKSWNTGLCYAVLSEKQFRIEFIDFFLQKGATAVNLALLTAAQLGDIMIADYLIRQGATDLNAALRAATFNGHKHMVQFLIDKGASNWQAAMQIAAEKNDTDLCQHLAFFMKKPEPQPTPWVSNITVDPITFFKPYSDPLYSLKLKRGYKHPHRFRKN